MDYENIINNLKQNIYKLMAYENIENTAKLIDRFILDLACFHQYEVIDLKGSYYIKKGVHPKAILHLNIDNNFDSNNISFVEDVEEIDGEVISGKNINLFNSVLIIASLLETSANDFDVLISSNNIQSIAIYNTSLSNIMRSDNVINLNLKQAKCIADEFSALILSNIKIPVERFNPDYSFKSYRLSLENLIGGHTGEDLDKVRLNAIKTIMSLIRKIKSKVDLDICKLQGGDRYDFIPSSAYVDFIIKEDYESDLCDTFKIYKNEFLEKNLKYEPDIDISLVKLEDFDNLPLTDISYTHLSSFVELIPTGAFSVNSNTNQLISSINLSTARSFENLINFIIVYRSLTEENMDQMLERTKIAADISASNINIGLNIPRWMNKDNYLTKKFEESYKTVTGENIDIIKTQYSLDSSVIFSKLNVKIVSLGVKYKQREDNIYFTNLDDILNVIEVIDDVLSHIYE